MKRILSIILVLLIIASLEGCNLGKPKFVQNLFSTDTELSEVKNVFSKSYNLEMKDLDYFRYYEIRLVHGLADIIQYRAANEDDYHFLFYIPGELAMIPLTPNVLSEYSSSDYTAIHFPLDSDDFGYVHDVDVYVLLDSSGKVLRYFDSLKSKVVSFEYDNDYVAKLQEGHLGSGDDLSVLFDISATIDLRDAYQYEYNDDYTLNRRIDPNETTIYGTTNYTYDNNGYRETMFQKSKEITKYYRDSDGLVIAIEYPNYHDEINYLPSGFVDY